MCGVSPIISIIVPVYNVEQYIYECIESIRDQTYRNLQIIIVDDGSTDDSGIICDVYARHDSRMTVLHQSNQGVTISRKHGLERAVGDYIGFVDGDDIIDSRMYEQLLHELIESGAEFIHSGYYQIKKNIQSIKMDFGKDTILLLGQQEEFLEDAVLGAESYIAPSIWSKLFRAGLIKKCFSRVPDDLVYGEDLICLCECLLEAEKIALLNEPYYYYRVREESLSNQYNLSGMKNELQLHDCLCKMFDSHGMIESMGNVLNNRLYRQICNHLKKSSADGFQVSLYRFSAPEILQNKKVIIYGAGEVGKDYYSQISRYTNCDIVAWVDKNADSYHFPFIELSTPKCIVNMKFDIVLIAVQNEITAKEITNYLLDMGIEKARIVWSAPRVLEYK